MKKKSYYVPDHLLKEDSMIRADKGITVNPWLILFFSRRKWDQRLTVGTIA